MNAPSSTVPVVSLTAPVVSLRGIGKRYRSNGHEYTALAGIDFDAHAGRLALLLGPSGSGKTTLLTVAAGFVEATEGTVSLFGHAPAAYRDGDLQRLRASRIGFVFQTFLLIDALTVAENIALQLRFSGRRGETIRRRAMEALEHVDIAGLADKRPPQLSHGERQRAAIARALATGAELLIADEPTASLDRTQGEAIIRLLHSCAADDGVCVIVASHDPRLRDFAHDIHHLENGRMVTPETVVPPGHNVPPNPRGVS